MHACIDHAERLGRVGTVGEDGGGRKSKSQTFEIKDKGNKHTWEEKKIRTRCKIQSWNKGGESLLGSNVPTAPRPPIVAIDIPT